MPLNISVELPESSVYSEVTLCSLVLVVVVRRPSRSWLLCLAGAGDPVMIEPKKGYKEETFRQDLFEKMMYKAGVEGKTITFLLPDTHIIKVRVSVLFNEV